MTETPSISLADQLYLECSQARRRLWYIGEVVTFVVESVLLATTSIKNSNQETYKFNFPVGLGLDDKLIMSDRNLTKEMVLEGVANAAESAVPLSAVYNLTTVMESFFHDLVRLICASYPKKIPKDEQISVCEVVSRQSIDEVKQIAIDRLISKLSYESPSGFASTAEKYLSFNLTEIPAWHQYVEMKATRDVHIHNKGIANDLYVRKASTLARADPGRVLPVTGMYMWRAYEACIKLTEEVERRLHEIWPSSMKAEFDRDLPEEGPEDGSNAAAADRASD